MSIQKLSSNVINSKEFGSIKPREPGGALEAIHEEEKI